mgnify:CR=1 FL=1
MSFDKHIQIQFFYFIVLLNQPTNLQLKLI